MSAVFARHPTRLFHGRGIAMTTAEELASDGTVMVVMDAAIGRTEAGRMTALGPTTRLVAEGLGVEHIHTLADEMRAVAPQLIVAVGGGTVLDATKVAAIALADRRVFEYAIAHATRSALTMIPVATPGTPVVAVPTTIGTSSETNRVGVVRCPNGFRLLVGQALAPRYAILDADHLVSLSDDAARAGGFEALMRVAGVSTVARPEGRAVNDGIAIARAVIHVMNGDLRIAHARLRLARLSAATQRTAALRGPDPYSARHWYVSNETAFHLGVPKTVATAAVVVAVWQRICAGDARWGQASPLRRFWRAATAGTGWHSEPFVGLREAISAWGLLRPSRPGDGALAVIAHACASSWGGRRPMLPGITAHDVRTVLEESFWQEREGGALCSAPSGRGR